MGKYTLTITVIDSTVNIEEDQNDIPVENIITNLELVKYRWMEKMMNKAKILKEVNDENDK